MYSCGRHGFVHLVQGWRSYRSSFAQNGPGSTVVRWLYSQPYHGYSVPPWGEGKAATGVVVVEMSPRNNLCVEYVRTVSAGVSPHRGIFLLLFLKSGNHPPRAGPKSPRGFLFYQNSVGRVYAWVYSVVHPHIQQYRS